MKNLFKQILPALLFLCLAAPAPAPAASSSAASTSVTPAYLAHVKKQAADGNAAAAFNLGVLYHNGDGVTRDDQKSIFWLKKAADEGDKDAPLNLYALYSSGTGVKKDLKAAADWCKRAALAGNARAAFVLADLYKQGKGVAQSNAQATRWLIRGLHESGTLPHPPLPSRGLNVKAALLSGGAGLVIFCGILFYFLRRRKNESSAA